jgi:hypothetical protein
MALSLSMNTQPHAAVAQRDVVAPCGIGAFIRPEGQS